MTVPFMMVDAALLSPTEKKVYFLSVNTFLVFDQSAGQFASSTPKAIAEEWPNLPTTGGFNEGDFDGACYRALDGNYYFFKEAQVLAYNWASKKAVSGYPKAMSTCFVGWPRAGDPGIDGSLYDPATDWVYFFKGGGYLVVDFSTGTVMEGYPRAVMDGWPG
jgi:hypothetical protein